MVTADQKASEVPFTPAGTIASTDVQAAIAEAASEAEQSVNKNGVNGYPGLDGSSKLNGSQQTYGFATNTAAQGNEARLVRKTIQIHVPGTLSVKTYEVKAMIPGWLKGGSGAITLVGVRGIVNTAPTDATLIIDVLKGGVSIYSAQGNMINITTGTTSDDADTIQTATASADDEYSLQVEQIGSTLPGADLTVMLEFDVVPS